VRVWLTALLLTVFLAHPVHGAVTDTIQASDFESSGISQAEAARFLNQATFGATLESIEQLRADGYRNWIRKQWGKRPSSHLAYLDALGLPENQVWQLWRMGAWFTLAVTAEDQLRQRVAWALSQIWVISDESGYLHGRTRAMAHYYDLLLQQSAGNYRQLMEDITLNPLMGVYLSMFQNQRANPDTGILPDENYAREIMQLFSIGLVELNPDGTPVLDINGQPVPTYGQDDIKALARVFTGWTRNGWDNGDGICAWWEFLYHGDDEGLLPMEPCEVTSPSVSASYNFHDTDAKVLFSSVNFPAGQDARQDLAMALDVLFNHPNVGPFIGKQLIQRLVTSNPSPAYVARVAAVFDDNGQGVRGDLAAVVEAILLDDEARNGHLAQPNQFGKLREPLLRQTHLWRALGGVPQRYDDYQDGNPEGVFGQAPLRAPSVFNFYRPDYSPDGPLQAAGLLAPEFQILGSATATSTANRFWYLTLYNQGQWLGKPADDLNWQTGVALDLAPLAPLAADVNTLLDRLDLVLLSGQMSAGMRSILAGYLNTLPYTEAGIPDGYSRVLEAVYLIITSPEYAVQR